MAKPRSHYVCQDCGAAASKWAGRCEGCGAWNSLVEESVQSAPGGLSGAGLSGRARAAGKTAFVDLEIEREPRPSPTCGIAQVHHAPGGRPGLADAPTPGGEELVAY